MPVLVENRIVILILPKLNYEKSELADCGGGISNHRPVQSRTKRVVTFGTFSPSMVEPI